MPRVKEGFAELTPGCFFSPLQEINPTPIDQSFWKGYEYLNFQVVKQVSYKS
jgi:hypothetical protein